MDNVLTVLCLLFDTHARTPVWPNAHIVAHDFVVGEVGGEVFWKASVDSCDNLENLSIDLNWQRSICLHLCQSQYPPRCSYYHQ